MEFNENQCNRIKNDLETLLQQDQSSACTAQILLKEPMRLHTTFRVGGPADLFVIATPQAAAKIRQYCTKNEMPFLLVGRGSNLLVSDRGLCGVVLMLEGDSESVKVDGQELSASAGVTMAAISRTAQQHGLTGLEFASGIPGTVGGGVVMNAGAYGQEIKDVLKKVSVCNKEGSVQDVPAEELALSYRKSIIPDRDWIVLSAVFSMENGDPDQIRSTMEDLTARRKEKQPLEFPSAGSTFKRPEGHFAGKLIEDAGLRGFAVGGAMVSEKHCGFVINTGEATADDICRLIKRVQEKVMESSGILLEPEVKLLGFDKEKAQ